MARPRPAHALTRREEILALVHPLRRQIFEALTTSPRTAHQTARLLRTGPTRLYHHFAVLERAGLIGEVERRQKRGTTERYYKAVAPRVQLDPALLNAEPARGSRLLASVLRTTIEELTAAVGRRRSVPPPPPLLLKRLRIRATRAKAKRLLDQLQRWLDACAEPARGAGAEEYGVTVAFYPRTGR